MGSERFRLQRAKRCRQRADGDKNNIYLKKRIPQNVPRIQCPTDENVCVHMLSYARESERESESKKKRVHCGIPTEPVSESEVLRQNILVTPLRMSSLSLSLLLFLLYCFLYPESRFDIPGPSSTTNTNKTPAQNLVTHSDLRVTFGDDTRSRVATLYCERVCVPW